MGTGWEISKITDLTLKNLANRIDAENTKDGFLRDKEITIFCEGAKDNPALTDTILGFYNTNPITAEAKKAEAKTSTETSTKKPTQKETSEMKNAIKKAISELAKDENKTSIQEVLGTIKNEYSDADYSDVVMETMTLANYIVGTGYNSKKDINNIRTQLEGKLTPYQKQLLGDFIKIAERDVIYREANKLLVEYETLVDGKKDEKLNYTELLNKVKESETYKSEVSYKREAYKILEKAVKADIQDNNALTRAEIIRSESKVLRTADDVQRKVKAQYNSKDKVAYDASNTNAEKADSGIVARYEKKEYTKTKVLTNISEETIRKELGAALFQKIKSGGYLDNHRNGKGYNLSELSDLITKYMGYDFLMNNSNDTEAAEPVHTIRALNAAFNKQETNVITKDDLKKIMKLCGLEWAPRNRNFGTALLATISPTLAGIAAGATQNGMVQSQRMSLEINRNLVTDSVKKQLLSQGATISNADNTANVLITMTQSQTTGVTQALIGALKGLGIGAAVSLATGLIINLIFGVEENERTCVSQTLEALTNGSIGIEEFENILRKELPAGKADIIMELANSLDTAGLDWKDELRHVLSQKAGYGSQLNCLELRGARLFAKHIVIEGEQEQSPRAYVADKAAVEEKGHIETTEEDVPVLDGRKTSWTNVTEMYGDYLKNKFPNLSDRIRVVKIAQAITDGNYTEARLRELLAVSRKGLKAMKNVTGIDYKVYESVITGSIIGDIKVPKNLAGCNREKERPDDANFRPEHLGGTEKALYAEDKVVTNCEYIVDQEAQSGEYWFRFGDILKKFDTDSARNEYRKSNNFMTIPTDTITVEKIKK